MTQKQPAEIMAEMLLELRALAAAIPSQGGTEIGPWLEEYAAEVPRGTAIVELGCWLGAGTAQLALGARRSHATIYSFDRFVASAAEVEKARARGIRLDEGQDTLPVVEVWLRPFPAQICLTRRNLKHLDIPADFPKIGLYVDAATTVEPLWQHAVDSLFGNFIPYDTKLVLMDYHFDETAGPNYAAQKRWIKRHHRHFELIDDRMAGTTAAAFRYLG